HAAERVGGVGQITGGIVGVEVGFIVGINVLSAVADGVRHKFCLVAVGVDFVGTIAAVIVTPAAHGAGGVGKGGAEVEDRMIIKLLHPPQGVFADGDPAIDAATASRGGVFEFADAARPAGFLR